MSSEGRVVAVRVDSGVMGSRAVARIGRYLPLLLILTGLALFLLLGLHRQLTFDALGRNHDALLLWVERYGMLAPIAFACAYAVSTALSLPLGLLLTVAAGLLFGPVLGTIVVVTGATTGATVLFLAARTAIGAALRARAGPAVARMARGFEQDAFNYLLVLRLVPLFPFWLINVVPAFTGVSLRTYVLATAIGIIPATIVFVLVGNGIGSVAGAGQPPDASIFLQPRILAPLAGLAVLALVPVAYKRLRLGP
jgi:uncharacterized membrane protein YdjX (TVP38/TMEM64 family)